ncbi:MAG: hypothetical protein Kow0042_20370 [Calditrichia bacterium]
MFYFPKITEINQFLNRIKPHILLTYVDPESFVSDQYKEFFNSAYLQDIWVIFLISNKLTVEQLQSLGKFAKSLVFFENVKPEVIAYNIKSILKQQQLELTQSYQNVYAENLFNCSKIINQESDITSLFEKLINFLPKFLSYDYWALFTFDPEFNQVTNFIQFIPPHKRNLAILTPNLEKLAEIWVQRSKGFRVNITDDPQLFRKLGEWGWGIRQLHFAPMIVQNLPIGGMILGNTNQSEIDSHDVNFIEEISGLLAQKIYNIFKLEKTEAGENDFAEQLIHNRFSEESILQLACKQINEASKGDNTVFWQLNRGFGFIFPKYSYARESGGDWRSLEKNMIFLEKDKQLNQLISSEKIQVIQDVEQNHQFAKATVQTFKKLGYRNLMIVPLRVSQEEMGLFIANKGKEGDTFGVWEIDQVSTLLEKVQRVLEDTSIVKEAQIKLKQLARIFELGNEIKLDLNLEAILSRITKSIRKTLNWNDVVILRSNNFRKVYRPISHVGFDSEKDLPINVLKNVSFSAFEKFLLNCKRISHSFFYDSHPFNVNANGDDFLEDVVTEWHPQDLLIVPIETRSKLLGYMVVRDPVERLKPNEDKVISLEYFANQAAVAIENSILYENLLASEERYRSLAETMTLGLVTCSPEGKIVYVNPAFENLVGSDRRALSRRNLADFFTDFSRPRLSEILHMILNTDASESKHIENVELELISKNGENIPVSTFGFPFFQQGQKIGAFFVLNDLRVIKKLERLKADFNSMIVHDLRSPMNVIQGFIELIRTRVVGDINAEQEELLDIAKENVKKVLTLIDNFLVASKMEVGRFNIEPKVSEIHSLIERILDNHQILVKNKNIKLERKLNENLPLLYFDSLRIEQVLNNLLSNAIKFTPEGETILVTTDFYQKKIKGETKMFARIGVHDNGPGIPPEKAKQIFEKYEQVDATLAINSSGTGLGLSICKEIVSLHGGEIWVESGDSGGSHFYFTLPIEPSIDKYLK